MLQKNLKLQNLFIVVVSYIFYGWWDYRFLFLIALTSLCSWLSGVLIEKVRERSTPPTWFSAKTLLISNIILNLAILGFFKYYNFFVDSFIDRWHISLNTWFVDYLYIPLGSSRPYVSPYSKYPELTKKAKVIRNTFAIFLTSGLWHGANWTFIARGAYHAILFIPLILLGKNKRFIDTVATGRILPNLREVFQMLLT